jgi:hypothetical protein
MITLTTEDTTTTKLKNQKYIRAFVSFVIFVVKVSFILTR